jgi:hypothetical protein
MEKQHANFGTQELAEERLVWVLLFNILDWFDDFFGTC